MECIECHSTRGKRKGVFYLVFQSTLRGCLKRFLSLFFFLGGGGAILDPLEEPFRELLKI